MTDRDIYTVRVDGPEQPGSPIGAEEIDGDRDITLVHIKDIHYALEFSPCTEYMGRTWKASWHIDLNQIKTLHICLHYFIKTKKCWGIRVVGTRSEIILSPHQCDDEDLCFVLLLRQRLVPPSSFQTFHISEDAVLKLSETLCNVSQR